MKEEEIERMSKFEESNWWFAGRRRIIINMLQKQLGTQSNLRILDVGCGSGYTTLALTKFGSVYGTDYSLSALKHCNESGLDKVVKSNSYYLPFRSETFDVITILDVLEHIDDDIRVLKELKRVLKKDGIILIAVPAFQFLWSEHDVALSHFRRYNHKSLSTVIIRSGFYRIRLTYFISFLFPILVIYKIIDKPRNSNPKSTLIRLPNFINKLLRQVLFLEDKILQKTNLPFGTSLICLAKINSNESFF